MMINCRVRQFMDGPLEKLIQIFVSFLKIGENHLLVFEIALRTDLFDCMGISLNLKTRWSIDCAIHRIKRRRSFFKDEKC